MLRSTILDTMTAAWQTNLERSILNSVTILCLSVNHFWEKALLQHNKSMKNCLSSKFNKSTGGSTDTILVTMNIGLRHFMSHRLKSAEQSIRAFKAPFISYIYTFNMPCCTKGTAYLQQWSFIKRRYLFSWPTSNENLLSRSMWGFLALDDTFGD